MRRTALKTLGLVALAAAAIAYLINPTFAADKGGPPVKVDAEGNAKNLFTGCYGQVGGGGLFAETSEVLKHFAVGAGCDWQVNAIVVGVSGKYAFGEADLRALTISGRIGWAMNPHTLAYGHVGLLMDGRRPDLNDSIVMGGIGLETHIARNITIFLEAATDLGKWGDPSTLPQVYEVSGGARIRF